MKRYIKSNSEKPILKNIQIEWEDIDNGIKFTVYSYDDEVLFEEVFDYSDVDPDAIYDSAIDMAKAALSLRYKLSDEVINILESAGESL